MAQGDLKYTERDEKVKIISEHMKATNESLKDAAFLAGEINSELLSDIRITLDNQLLVGTGTGTELHGIMPQASTFAAGTQATAVVSPNNADVLRVAINQIVLAGKGRWMPSHILMNPDDVVTLDLAKIADGRYIEIPFYDGEKPSVIKVPIMQNTGITVGSFLVGDFSKAKAFLRDSLTIRIYDQNEDDPIFNRSTITGNVRLAFRIKNQEKAAFVKGDFATAITALTKP
jgi:HK97 family phage major capsid protein